MRAAAADGDLTHPTALLAETKPIDDLAGDERRKHRVVARRIEEADYPDHRIEQACVEPAHGHHLDRVIHPRGVEPSLDQDLRIDGAVVPDMTRNPFSELVSAHSHAFDLQSLRNCITPSHHRRARLAELYND